MNDNLVGFWSCMIIANVCFTTDNLVWTLLGFAWIGLALWFWYSEKKGRRR